MDAVTEALDPHPLVKVGNSTGTKDLGRSLYRSLREGQLPVVRGIGAGSVNQAAKGIAEASSLMAQHGQVLTASIGFETVPGESGDNVSATVFRLRLE